jgi:dihydroxyacetone kinase
MADRLAGTLSTASDHAILINNLGGVPPIEMSLIADAVLKSSLSSRIKLIIGPAPLMTALNMNGFSLSLLKLDEVREAALAADVGPTAWCRPVLRHPIDIIEVPPTSDVRSAPPASADLQTEQLLRAVCTHLISLEAELNRLDARSGDGDTGATVATGARSLLNRIETLPLADPAKLLAAIGAILSTSMGGSSGVLLSIFFTAASKALDQTDDMPAALIAGLARMTFYGGAKPGDRTMVDALDPALRALARGSRRTAAQEAEAGAEATKAMTKANAGRATYVSARNLEGVADPGAVAVAEVFRIVADLA